jgi:Na+/H+ antiporter NhaD/arsenite permease-like protein
LELVQICKDCNTIMKRIGLFGLALIGVVGTAPWLSGSVTNGDHSPAFFIAGGVFLLVFTAISLRWMHETAAALLGAAVLLSVHYIGGTFSPALRIISFEEAMAFVDWNVIFLILGMMIFMAIFSETGVFQWLAFRAFQMARGNVWLLGIALVLLTGLVSAFLNDVTAILLLAPLSIEIALAAGVHPFTFIIPEVLASNIGGAATLIGDPPSTIVGSHLGLSFIEYLVNVAPIALICMAVLLGMMRWLYRHEYANGSRQVSPTLVARLEEGARITNFPLLRKAGLLAVLTLIFFFAEDYFGMPPSVVAMTGAALLIAWVRPDMHHMLREVDWTTLIFFIGLFILMGGLEAAGVIAWTGQAIHHLAGDNLTLAVVLMVWVSGLVSAIVANIPFTIAALPIADLLSASIPGAESRVLYWALILGADLGGNATYLGSAPNIVSIGLLRQAGYPLTFTRFMRDGVPVTVVTLLLATIWLLLRY